MFTYFLHTILITFLVVCLCCCRPCEWLLSSLHNSFSQHSADRQGVDEIMWNEKKKLW